MCRSLLQNLIDVKERIRRAGRVSLFLDFDGTLVPFTRDPAQASLDERTRKTLTRISRNDRFITTIISGRAISDLRSRIGLKRFIYAGNHGLEIRGRQLRFLEPTAAAQEETLRQLSRELATKLQATAGAVVEYKGLTTSIHYRQAAVRDVPQIEAAVRAAVLSAGQPFEITPGKMVFDIMPRTNWQKGAAVSWINERLGNVLSIYLGDDSTDESAFRVLPEGVTVKVGSFTATSAHYHLAGPPAVQAFLIWLADQRARRTKG